MLILKSVNKDVPSSELKSYRINNSTKDDFIFKVRDTKTNSDYIGNYNYIDQISGHKLYSIFGVFKFYQDTVLVPISDLLWKLLDYIEDSEIVDKLPKYDPTFAKDLNDFGIVNAEGNSLIIQPSKFYNIDDNGIIYISSNFKTTLSLLDIFLFVVKNGIDLTSYDNIYLNIISGEWKVYKLKLNKEISLFLTKVISLKKEY